MVEPDPDTACICPAHGTEFVRWVQHALNQLLNVRLRVDGMMNRATREAVRSFQRQRGLPVDGIVGPETERALIAARASTSDHTPDRPADRLDAWTSPDGLELDLDLTDFELEQEAAASSQAYTRWVQGALNHVAGQRLAVDGIYGSRTRNAVRAFQAQQGLMVDGIVGPRTEAALVAAGATRPPARAPSLPAPTPPAVGPDITTVKGFQVARQIAPQVDALLTAAASAGIQLKGWGYRSTERQIELRKRHCGTSHYDIYDKPSSQCNPPTAPPGRSMHEQGLAIDFTHNGESIRSQNSPAFRWLAANAPRFGLYNLPSEPWHWSINGR